MKRKLFFAAMLLVGASGFNAHAQVNGESYYLYNEDTGLFVSRGKDWGTRSTANYFGIAFTFAQKSDNVFSLKNVDHSLVANKNLYFADNLFTDGTECSWTVIKSGEKIKLSKSNQYLQLQSAGDYLEMVNDVNSATEWTLLTKTEYLAKITATKDAEAVKIANAANISDVTSMSTLISQLGISYIGKDATSKITNASFSTTDNGWQIQDPSNGNRVGNHGFKDNCYEFWNGTAVIKQQITELPKGVYKLTMQGFYRFGGADIADRVKDNGCMTAYVYAGDYRSQLIDWYTVQTDNNPNDRAQAYALFSAGKAVNEVYAYVGDAGVLEIGVYSAGWVDNNWPVLRNFTLTYYTDQVSDEDAQKLLDAIPDGAMNAEIKAALNTAKTTFETSKTVTNYNALQAAIEAANQSIAAYAQLAAAFEEAEDIKTETSKFGATYTATFDTKIAAIKSGYEAGNFKNDEIPAQVALVNDEVVLLVKSQTEAGADLTRAAENASCEAGADHEKPIGWTTSGNNGHFEVNVHSVEADESGMKTPFIENWIGRESTLTSAKVSHDELEGLNKGLYQVTGLIRVYSESGLEPAGVTIFANAATKEITEAGKKFTYNGMKGVYDNLTVTTEVGEDGKLNFGFTIDEGATFNWLSFKNFTITYLGEGISAEQAEELLTSAKEVAEGKMNKDVREALNTAISNFEGDKTSVDYYNELEVAIAAANSSIEAYVHAKTILAELTAEFDKTNFYTAEAYKEHYTDICEAYEAETLTDAAARALSIGDGTKVRVPNNYDDVLLSAWKINGEQAKDYDKALYINTWSTEGNTDGSEYKVPFFEYWVANGESLADATIEGKVAFPEGRYKVTAWVRVRVKDNANAAPTGITMTVNDGEAVDVAAGTKIGSSQLYLKEFTAYGDVTEEGTLAVTFEVNGTNINWLAFKNVYVSPVIVLDETATTAPEAQEGVDVMVNRTMIAEKWNSFCVPFDMEIPEGWNVQELKASEHQDDAIMLTFAPAETIEAGVPYLVKPETAVTSFEAENVNITPELKNTVTDEVTFEGNYVQGFVPEGSYFINASTFYVADQANYVTLKGFRAIITPKVEGMKNVKIFIDNEAVNIADIQSSDVENGAWYTVQGLKVNQPTQGIYIHNGKKVYIK